MTLRLPLPQAYGDPAFLACIQGATETPELFANFDRLYGASLVSKRSQLEKMVDAACGKDQDDMRKFVEFIHDSVYLRLPDYALDSLRVAAMEKQAESQE